MASAKPIRRPTSEPPASRSRPREQRFEDASTLYGIPNWGKGFFHVSEEGDLSICSRGMTSTGTAFSCSAPTAREPTVIS